MPSSTSTCSPSRRYAASAYVTANSSALTSLEKRASKSPDDARAKKLGGSVSNFWCNCARRSATTRWPKRPMQKNCPK